MKRSQKPQTPTNDPFYAFKAREAEGEVDDPMFCFSMPGVVVRLTTFAPDHPALDARMRLEPNFTFIVNQLGPAVIALVEVVCGPMRVVMDLTEYLVRFIETNHTFVIGALNGEVRAIPTRLNANDTVEQHLESIERALEKAEALERLGQMEESIERALEKLIHTTHPPPPDQPIH